MIPRADAGDIGRRFHFAMFVGCSLLLLIILICAVKAPVAGWPAKIVVALVLTVISAVPALFWQDRKDYVRRDAALALPWTCVLIILLPVAAVLSAQLQFPLRDALFKRVDLAMGFNDIAIVSWSSKHRFVGATLDHSYDLLVLLLATAALLPALSGKKEAAEKFVLANTIAFLVSFPFFAFLPAVGPWYGFHFPANKSQLLDEAATIALHSGAPVAAMAGILCFPSFHVIWAALSAWALWSVKPMRVLATAIAMLVVLSTVTTGWHYAADVIAGLIVAAASWLLAVSIINGGARYVVDQNAGVSSRAVQDY
jgi:hypothetical protein